jgi:hypothetical protein
MLSATAKSRIAAAYKAGTLLTRTVSPTGQVELRPILQVSKAEVPGESLNTLTLDTGASLTVTGGHRIFTTPVVKVESAAVTPGCTVYALGGVREVKSNVSQPCTTPVYDLTTEGWHNFVLHRSGVVVSNSPDRNYRFRPPAHEDSINQFNKVFGYIWTEEELSDFLTAGLDMVAAAPPYTGFSSVEQLMQTYPQWRTLVLNGAMMQALFALQINWSAEEFSVHPETQLTVRTPEGMAEVTIHDLYEATK